MRANSRKLLETYIGEKGPDLIFICHSRGGLVARAVAAKLLLGNRRWRKRIKGILTFGTPHDGAELAKSSVGQEAVAYWLLQSGTSWAAALPYFLGYLGHLKAQGRDGEIEGNRDLSPVSNGYSNFLSELTKIRAQDRMVDDPHLRSWRRRMSRNAAGQSFLAYQESPGLGVQTPAQRPYGQR